jgi:type IV pilus assembly protein PilV
MANRHAARRGERGTTLLEAMISLAILLVALVGMARLQVFGMSSTQGARAQTVATQLAAELGGALSRLPAEDARLVGTPSASSTPDVPPANFGRILSVGTSAAGIHVFDDANPVPGARLDATLERDPADATLPIYRRRWTVWDAGVTSSGTAAKVIAVSVVYRERTLPAPREVVLYVHSEIRGNFMANINAFN